MFKTTDERIINIEEFTWKEARLLIEPLNPTLVSIIDEISPDDRFKLYKASYPFGVRIINKSDAFLPLTDGGLISFNDPSLPSNLKKNLSYDPKIANPIGMTLEKYSECYLSILDQILPYAIMGPGHIFGVTRALDVLERNDNNSVSLSFFMWELTSGVRSIFMLPKVTENLSHNRLKKIYGVDCDKPKSLQDHWLIFKNISDAQKSTWRSSFLYFSNNWFEHLDDPAWSKLYNFFLRNNRQSYEFWRNILSWQITFNLLEKTKNIRFSTYTLDNAKHLFAIAAGSLPGFRPAINDESAPIKLIQEAYIKGYDLLGYWPVIMEPATFSHTDGLPIYYSLNYPTLIQSDPNAFKGSSIITLLDELIGIVNKYVDGIKHNHIAAETSLYKTAKDIKFSYYHNDPTKNGSILNAAVLEKEDSRFKASKIVGQFPQYAPFLKGCIKIAPTSS